MRLPALLALLLLAGLGLPALARACSCAGGDPRQRLAAADGAIVGIVESKREERVRPWDGIHEMDGWVYVIRVEKAYKGDPGERIELATPRYEVSCGLEEEAGAKLGLLLRGDGPRYGGGVCDTIDPHKLEAASRPFPQPRGSGRLEVLVAGAFGDAGLVGYDRRGRLLGYAFGSEGRAVSVCPGGRYALQAGPSISRIRLRDLRVVMRRGGFPGDDVHALRCLDARGRSAVAVAYDYGANTHPRVVRWRNGTSRRLGSLSGLDALVSGVSLDPGGRWAAMAADARVVLVDLRTMERTERSMAGHPRRAVWLGRDTFALFPEVGRGRVLDRSLRERGRLPSMRGYPLAAAGRVLYSLDFPGRLLRAGRGASVAREIARVPRADVGGLAAVPGGVALRTQRRAARPAAAAAAVRRPCRRAASA